MGIFQRLCQSRELRRQLELSRNRLYRTAYSWCHDTHLADDLVQQTLLKALQNTHQLSSPQNNKTSHPESQQERAHWPKGDGASLAK